jgi:hypothetical protein
MKEEEFYKVENGETLQNNIELLLEDIELRKKLSFGNLIFFFKSLLTLLFHLFRIEKTGFTY